MNRKDASIGKGMAEAFKTCMKAVTILCIIAAVLVLVVLACLIFS